ncbi:MAG TPA: cupin domain-containing protein [Candidatus Acidoferrum sp.]|nr:cupin domain-containing protein [Candidatus Acidoferrum sp.]
MELVELDSIATFSEDKYSKIPINGTKGLIRLLCFKPNQSVPLHKHPEGDEYFFVVKGKGRVRVGNEEIEVGSGTIVRAPANVLHQWKNGTEKLILLSVLIAPSCYGLAEEILKMEYI